jgi:hypothetical protein
MDTTTLAIFFSMYDKVLAALKEAPADSNIVDLYTVYDFVSMFLSGVMIDKTIKITSINATRLRHATEHISEQNQAMPAFFDCDKTYYGKLNLAGAMTTAGYTPEEQAWFQRIANKMIKPISHRPSASTHHSIFTDQDEEVQGTAV